MKGFADASDLCSPFLRDEYGLLPFGNNDEYPTIPKTLQCLFARL
jgi:hypothetical protein